MRTALLLAIALTGTAWAEAADTTVAALPAATEQAPAAASAPAEPSVAMRTVPVLAAPVGPNQRIEVSNITTKEVEARSVFANTITDIRQLEGMQSTRRLAAGTPITNLQVKTAMDVQRNDLVTLTFAAPGLQLSGSAQALEDGRVGQSIRVLNPSSRATLVGLVTGPNAVEMR